MKILKLLIDFHFYLRGRNREGREREGERERTRDVYTHRYKFSVCCFSPDACGTTGRTRLNPRARNSIPSFHRVTESLIPEPPTCYLPRYTLAGSWNQSRAGTPIQALSYSLPKQHLQCCTHSLQRLLTYQIQPHCTAFPCNWQ